MGVKFLIFFENYRFIRVTWICPKTCKLKHREIPFVWFVYPGDGTVDLPAVSQECQPTYYHTEVGV